MAAFKFMQPVYMLSERGKKESGRKAMADVKSISAAEFFSAEKGSGIKPKFICRVRSFEYKGEKQICIDDVIYSVYRTYDTAEGITELYLSPKMGEMR